MARVPWRIYGHGPAAPIRWRNFPSVQGFKPWGWVIGSGVYVDDLAAAARETWLRGLALAGAAGLVVALLAIWIALGVVRPLRASTLATKALAGGALDTAVPGLDRGDEFGVLARALDGFRRDGLDKRRLEAEAAAARAQQDRRHAAMERHTNDFGGSVSGVLRILADSAKAIRTTATCVAQAGTSTRDAARSSSAGARRSTASLTQVAAATEQLSSSVGEVARQVNGATTAASEAVASAEATTVRIRGLSAAADQIGEVVSLIREVAGRTNLLALNATIEAARAGASGKGFAVVASEVKQLAEQTRKATEAIAGQVATIQAATGEAVEAVGGVAKAIGHVDAISAAIAAAVEQQGAATREIATQVSSVAAQTLAATEELARMAALADDSVNAGDGVLAAAHEVTQVTETLRTEVELFLDAARAAGDNRRRHDRVAGGGLACELRETAGATVRAAKLLDIACGGAAIRIAGPDGLASGTPQLIQFHGEPCPAHARVARVEGDTVAVVFRQDPATLEIVERVLARLSPTATPSAAVPAVA